MRRHITGPIGIGVVSLLLSSCGGGAMTETESDSVSAGSAVAADTAAEETPIEAAGDVDRDSYRAELGELIRETWRPPNRANTVPPRIAVATVFLGPGGRVVSWTWRRRSPAGRFNESIANHLDRLVNGPRQFPLPPEGSVLRAEVLRDGVAIQFADDDA